SVLIDGRGHIYHHGEEGTNSSLAHARIVAHQVGLNWMTTTSDATEAYRLAGHPVSRVARTVVYVKPDFLVVFDAIDLEKPLPVEVRFQAHNRDGNGSVMAEDYGFLIQRPQANLQAVCGGVGPLTVGSGELDLPVDMGVYPYASVASEAALRHRIVSVARAFPKSGVEKPMSWEESEGTWLIGGSSLGATVNIRIEDKSSGMAPIVSVARDGESPW
ncbi:MAG: hypothetical protein ACKVI3_10630, partial [Verrucomicrobiia bacterium]